MPKSDEREKVRQKFLQIGAGSVRFIATREEVLDFIMAQRSSVRQEEREALREGIETLRAKWSNDRAADINESLDEVLFLLDKK